jgi:Cys-rich repeat protein
MVAKIAAPYRWSLGIAVPLLALACASEEGRGVGTSLSGGGQGGLSGVTSASMSTTDSDGSSGSDSSGEDAASDAASGDASSGGGTSGATGATTGTSGGDPNGLPNSAECSEDAQCMSGTCYKNPIPIGDLPPGVCSVCKDGADCAALGLGISCTLDPGLMQATCVDGGVGSFCESQASCKAGLFCEPLVAGAQGLLPMVCGTCRTDADCAGGRRCTPSIDVENYSGHKFCALPGALINDALCPMSDGDALCASGHCELADLGGLLEVAICGECAANSDCPGGQTCMAGSWVDGPVGSRCG